MCQKYISTRFVPVSAVSGLLYVAASVGASSPGHEKYVPN